MPGIDESLPFHPLRIALLTVSDTRTAETDSSGDLLEGFVAEAGHEIAERRIVRDEIAVLTDVLGAWIVRRDIDVVISTGGTGLTGRDLTPEAYRQVIDKEIPGFGELFRMLSYETVGTSAMQSRAMAGVSGETYLFALPGSRGAVRDGWTKILRFQLDSRHQPCNFVDLIPRLNER
ncbi:MAG: molybdenum cofactor biosynthesis protein B [Myxococcota bacterium]